MNARNSGLLGMECLTQAAVISLDRAGGIDFLCQNGRDLLGWDIAQSRGRQLCDLFPWAAPVCQSAVAAILSGAQSVVKALLPFSPSPLPSGTFLALRIEARSDADGRVDGGICLVFAVDATDGGIAGRDGENVSPVHPTFGAWQESERIRPANWLAADFAQEINQPLATIVTYLQVGDELLRRNGQDTSAFSTLFEKIGRQTQSAARILRSLQTLYGKTAEVHKAININGLIESSLAAAQQDLLACNVRIQCEFAEDLPEVDVIPTQIQMALLILLAVSRETLARDATHPCIVIGTERLDKNYVKVRLSGNGHSSLGEIEEGRVTPFFSASVSGTDYDAERIGTELSSCRSIIESHGGTLNLRAECAEDGALDFTLPVVQHFNGDEQ